MKHAPAQRLSTLLLTGLAASALATGTASADPPPAQSATPIAACNTGSSAPSSAIQNGLGGNLGAFLWPLENAITCLTSGSSGTTSAAAPVVATDSGSGTGSAGTGSSALSSALNTGSHQVLCATVDPSWANSLGCGLPPSGPWA
ncbi:hypothetical protein GPX89_33030 [Nocardia sp. ET3-3]|uniref:Secreted protein n=1 Tax=Nocardia terrae TaxID=2675851 RepID=A0A7K1V6F7_9NOCA|nr:hypothetical protein [Nocardia terrae]MVU82051.1 hypothetical protein [Nocardia terrae]